jgi:hypothetical protein
MLGIPNTKNELERWVVREGEGSVQYLPLQGLPLMFYEGPLKGQQIPESAKGAILFVDELAYTWVDVPDVPWAAIQACVGKINRNPFDGAGNGAWPVYAPGTLLMQAPKRRRHRNPTGRVSWDIVYRFLYRPQGWNNYPAAAIAGGSFGFFGASFDGTPTGQKAYGDAEYDALFIPPPPVNYQP